MDRFQSLRRFYDENVKAYRDDIRSPAWGSRKSQEARFKILAAIGPLRGARILDVGCGLGDFYGWLKSHERGVRYFGIDLTASMVALAREKHPGVRFKNGNFLSTAFGRSEQYDYVFASGIFNRRISGHPTFLHQAIAKMFRLAKIGVAFNILSTQANRKEKHEFYADPGAVLAFCLRLSRKVVLRHDYMPHDFTIYLYKTNSHEPFANQSSLSS